MLSKRLLGVLLTALLCCGGVVGAGGGGKGRKTEKKYKKLEKIERKCDAKIRPLRELLNLPLSSVAANARLMSDNAAMAAEIEQLKADKQALTGMIQALETDQALSGSGDCQTLESVFACVQGSDGDCQALETVLAGCQAATMEPATAEP